MVLIHKWECGRVQTRAIPAKISPYLKESPVEEARDCLLPMGITSEAVAAKYDISRERQDEFAARSQNKAENAQTTGKLASEIVPITVRYVNTETGEESQREVKDDEGIRKGITAQGLAKLKPAFGEGGRSTAANSSQISDGASAVTLARRDVAERLGLKPIGRFVGTTVKGCPPKLMGAERVFLRGLWIDSQPSSFVQVSVPRSPLRLCLRSMASARTTSTSSNSTKVNLQLFCKSG